MQTVEFSGDVQFSCHALGYSFIQARAWENDGAVFRMTTLLVRNANQNVIFIVTIPADKVFAIGE